MRTLRCGRHGACAFVLVASTALAGAPAPEPQWQSVAKTDLQEAFVDVRSRAPVAGGFEVAVRYEYASPQPFGRATFQSARNVYRLDCAAGRIADRENRVYAEHGLGGRQVAKSTRSARNLAWRDAAPHTVDGVVLDYVCRKMDEPPPAPVPAKR
jgi:hypothetical protein